MRKAVLLLLFCLCTALPGQSEETAKPSATTNKAANRPLRKPFEDVYFNGAHSAIPTDDLLDQCLEFETAGQFQQADLKLTDVLSQIERQPPGWWSLYYERAKCREHFDIKGATRDLLQASIFLHSQADHEAKTDIVSAVKSYSKIIGFYERAMVLHEQEKTWAGRGVDFAHDPAYIEEAVMIYDGAAKAYQRQADLYLTSHHQDYYKIDMAKAQQYKAKAAALAKAMPISKANASKAGASKAASSKNEH